MDGRWTKAELVDQNPSLVRVEANEIIPGSLAKDTEWNPPAQGSRIVDYSRDPASAPRGPKAEGQRNSDVLSCQVNGLEAISPQGRHDSQPPRRRPDSGSDDGWIGGLGDILIVENLCFQRPGELQRLDPGGHSAGNVIPGRRGMFFTDKDE